jgi:PAS domain S-box-containing protein
MADGMFVAQDRRFVFANPALSALLGYTPEAFAGIDFQDVVAPESLPVWNERFDQRVSLDMPEPERHYDVAFQHAQGHYVWMELRAARFQYQGRPAVLGLLRDMTERRLAPDMRQRPQLLRRQRAVGDRDAEHVGVQLQIDAVLQPQHLEFVLGELAGEAPLHLIAEFRNALVDERTVEFVICVHDG